MQFNLFAPVQAFLRPKNQFSLFFVAYFVAKLLHLGSHAASLPIVLYLLYFPTFLLPDILLLFGSKVLIYTQHGGQTSAIRKAIGGLLAIFTAGCAAAEISFFIETGGEIQWMAASRVLGGSGGLGLLLSGLPSMSAAFAVLYTIAWIITPRLYDVVDRVVERISSSFRWIYRSTKRAPDVKEDRVPLITLGDDQDSPPLVLERPMRRVPSTREALAVCFTTLTAIIVVIVLQSVRPTSPPYSHMSGSLPITLIEAAWFQPINSEFCLPHPVEAALFPYERLSGFYKQTMPPDWVPQSSVCSRTNGSRPPPWQKHLGDEKSPYKGVLLELGDSVKVVRDMFDLDHSPLVDFPQGPPGLSHDTGPLEYPGHGHQGGYTPVCDPLKLSNLEAGVLPSLTASMGNAKPKIKNILLLTLESTRKDMFPLKKNSHAYKTILATYKSPNATAELDAKLAALTDTAAFLSGESNGFGLPQKDVPEQSWRAAFKHDMGAINVDGAITQAAYTFKSLVSSHCGVEPLPVDFTEEFKARIYQACLPQIVEKLSPGGSETKPDQKHDHLRSRDKKEDYRSLDWSSALVQSVIDQFDNQDLLDEQMGFKHVITEATISDEKSKYFPPKQPWINYFGYAETETFGYLRDLFVDGQQQGKRVFVSHITSSTHHPFATPKDWVGRRTYMEKQHWRTHDPFEDYLNAIKYQDEWIADIFQMLHDTGALSETLVVMAGDHGLAFKSPDQSHSAVNNGHISNFAIPLLFVHPDLPRIQINASTTPLSIIPTVLDLLQETDSLSPEAAKIASELLPSYQGNSLIRNLDFNIRKTDGTVAEAFFQPFHFSVINPGGSLLAISDAATTFRLVLPLCSTIPLRFTDTAIDPNEADPIIAWTMDKLVAMIQVRHGAVAKDWVQLAEELGRWWFWNQREKWGYWGVARSTSRGGGERGGKGQIKHKHWWETK